MLTAREILDLLEKQRRKLGLSQADVSAKVLGPEKRNSALFQALRRGSMPSAKKLQAVASVLGLEFYFGPPREAKSEKYTPSLLTSEDAGEVAQGLAPVRDLQLAKVLAVIIEHYEQNNEYGRRNFIEEIKTRWPTLFADGGAPLARVVAWLGWKVLPGPGNQPEAGSPHRGATPGTASLANDK